MKGATLQIENMVLIQVAQADSGIKGVYFLNITQRCLITIVPL